MKHTAIQLTCLVVLASLISACTVVEKLTPVQPSLAPGTLLVEDDFSITPNGWGTMGRSGGEIGFEFEGLTILVNTPNFMFWTVNGSRFTDTRVTVDAVLLEGPADDNFGVICRFQDNKNFYGFVISHDGYYGIFKLVDGVIDQGADSTNLDFSDAIRQGGVVNHMEATCQGDTLSLSVNDTLLTQVKDSSFTEGQVGLIASAYADPGVKVLFDNLQVYQP
jgi:hypothetical protein